MWRLRSGAPSSHQTGPRSPSATLAASTRARASRRASPSRAPDRPARGHQVVDQRGAALLGERGVGHPPEAAADDEVAAVGGDGVAAAHPGRRHAQSSTTLPDFPESIASKPAA